MYGRNLPITGTEGEKAAAEFLKRKGYRIVETNYRAPFGEIDIIAWDGATLVFVEVKARSSDKFGTPEMAVGFRKQAQIGKIAMAYLLHKKLSPTHCRFDVISVLKTGEETAISLFQDAFALADGSRG